MPRRMSCKLTVAAVRDRSKTETRRRHDTWKLAYPGDRLTLIEQGMGLGKGQPQVVLCDVEVIENRLEPLALMTLDDVAAEGFGPGSHLGGPAGWTVRDFHRLWLGTHGYNAETDDPERVLVRVIRWSYL